MRKIVTYQGRIGGSELEFVKKLDLSFATELCETQRLKGRQGSYTSLLYLLHEHRRREATDPRDKVFAMLGLAEDFSPDLLKPNYSKSVGQIYRETTLASIKQTGSLEILRHTWEPVQRSEEYTLPSWVRSWEVPTSLAKEAGQYGHESPYRASAGSLASLNVSNDLSVLVIKGLYIDRVNQVGEAGKMGMGHNNGTVIRSWQAMLRVLQEPNRTYVSGGTFKNAYWRTLTMDLATGWDQSSPGDPFVRATIRTEVCFAIWCGWKGFEPKFGNTSEVGPLAYHVLLLAGGRRMVFLQSGYIGLVPAATMVGDHVCVLFGGSVPYVLRPEESYYRLIGDCYIHGLMDGEAIESLGKGAVQVQDFELR
jgi:hypothetical protein